MQSHQSGSEKETHRLGNISIGDLHQLVFVSARLGPLDFLCYLLDPLIDHPGWPRLHAPSSTQNSVSWADLILCFVHHSDCHNIRGLVGPLTLGESVTNRQLESRSSNGIQSSNPGYGFSRRCLHSRLLFYLQQPVFKSVIQGQRQGSRAASQDVDQGSSKQGWDAFSLDNVCGCCSHRVVLVWLSGSVGG